MVQREDDTRLRLRDPAPHVDLDHLAVVLQDANLLDAVLEQLDVQVGAHAAVVDDHLQHDPPRVGHGRPAEVQVVSTAAVFLATKDLPVL